MARSRRADLYLLCHPDVPWVAEGLYHDRGKQRREMHALFTDALRDLGARVIDVRGDWATRQSTAERAVQEVLAAQPAAS